MLSSGTVLKENGHARNFWGSWQIVSWKKINLLATSSFIISVSLNLFPGF